MARGRQHRRVFSGKQVTIGDIIFGKPANRTGERLLVGAIAQEGRTMKILTPSGTAHILFDEQGRAWIDDTNVKVIEVVLDKLGYGLSPEEIFEEHYRRISLAQIHAAFSYYYDRQAEFDAEIERQRKEVEAARAQTLDSPGRRKLRALGKIP